MRSCLRVLRILRFGNNSPTTAYGVADGLNRVERLFDDLLEQIEVSPCDEDAIRRS